MKENVLIAVAVIIVLAIGGYAVYKFNGQTNSTSTSQTQTNEPQSMHLITLKTTLGDIQFETYDQDSPKTVQNFITLANSHFYDGILFHRVISGFMDQAGDPLTKDASKAAQWGTGGPGYTIPDEFNSTSSIYQTGYVKGVVAMANTGAPNSGGSQFFIMAADYQLPPTYTIFGKVVAGQDVVDAINNLPTDPQNDRPLNPPKIVSVTVENK